MSFRSAKSVQSRTSGSGLSSHNSDVTSRNLSKNIPYKTSTIARNIQPIILPDRTFKSSIRQNDVKDPYNPRVATPSRVYDLPKSNVREQNYEEESSINKHIRQNIIDEQTRNNLRDQKLSEEMSQIKRILEKIHDFEIRRNLQEQQYEEKIKHLQKLNEEQSRINMREQRVVEEMSQIKDLLDKIREDQTRGFIQDQRRDDEISEIKQVLVNNQRILNDIKKEVSEHFRGGYLCEMCSSDRRSGVRNHEGTRSGNIDLTRKVSLEQSRGANGTNNTGPLPNKFQVAGSMSSTRKGEGTHNVENGDQKISSVGNNFSTSLKTEHSGLLNGIDKRYGPSTSSTGVGGTSLGNHRGDIHTYEVKSGRKGTKSSSGTSPGMTDYNEEKRKKDSGQGGQSTYSNTHPRVKEIDILSPRSEVTLSQESGLTPRGIANPAGYCYLNCVLQLLQGCSDFKKLVTVYHTSSSIIGAKGTDLDKVFVNDFCKFIAESKIKNTSKRRENIKKLQSYFDFTGADVLQCFMSVLTKIHNVINTKSDNSRTGSLPNKSPDQAFEIYKSKNSGFVFDLFYGMMANRTECYKCKRCLRQSFQLFKSLPFPVPISHREVPLEECLNDFLKESLIDSMEGPTCNCQNQRDQKICSVTRITHGPTYLFVYLNRGTYVRNQPKNNTFVSCGDNFYLPIRDSHLRYKLLSVVDHMGDSEYGHYYVKSCFESPKWYLINDDSVMEMKTPEDPIITKHSIVFLFKKNT